MTRAVVKFLAAGIVASGLVAVFLLGDPAPADDQPQLPPAANQEVDYARDVRPIFEKACIKCHGESRHIAGFRLDREVDALRGGDSGPPFEAGNSAESLLIKYVAGVDPDMIMPPDGKKLTEEQVGLLRAWIDQGAKWTELPEAGREKLRSKHWSFQPIRRPTEPVASGTGWARSPIDRFVAARLETAKIAPSPEADRRTLIRRLSLDLLGLPPTPTEVEAFVEDKNADAYERLVDRLLDSPHFGERWARHWLDLARYADSDGYEKDLPRPFAWRYRHWLIEAINRDLPFDQFTIEQLAGDLLPEATLDQKIATGFHRNTLTNKEGGVDQEEFRVAAVVDRVNTTSSVWLGLTMGCAQCHTHKYDPLTLREYYGLFAFFNQGQEVDLFAPLPAEAAAYNEAKARYDAAHAPFLAAIAEFDQTQLPARQAEWERSVDQSALTAWKLLVPEKLHIPGSGATFTRQSDGSYFVSGANNEPTTYTVTIKTDLAGITAFRLEVLPDERLPARGPGRAPGGGFVLTEFKVTARAGAGEVVPVVLQAPAADFSQDGQPISAAIDNRPRSGWGIAPQTGRRHIAVFETVDNVGGPETTFTITLDQRSGKQNTIGRFRLWATTAPRPVQLEGIPEELLPILTQSPAERTPDQKERITALYATTVDAEAMKLRVAEIEHAKDEPALPPTQAQTLTDVAERRKTHIHLRGDFLRKGDEISPHTPAVLSALVDSPGHVPDRLSLARWLVARENPLTARVAVNRIWKYLFGQALVTTMDDFGTRGEKPSHPELLDWLASEFMAPTIAPESRSVPGRSAEIVSNAGAPIQATPPGLPFLRGGGAWSVKRLIRLIVTSATYRQSSKPRSDLVDRDPKNVLLARQNLFRVEAEIVRDLSLAASGLLTTTIGGPSIRPPQAAGITELTYRSDMHWVASTGADRYRRGLYTWFQRTSPYPMLMTFDAPESNVTCTRRDRSNTPLQALTLLNDPAFHECAQALGRRMLKDRRGDATARLQYGFELCTARSPAAAELERLQQMHAAFREAATTDPVSAEKIVGEPRPAESELADMAAAVAVARVILNLDEFVMRE